MLARSCSFLPLWLLYSSVPQASTEVTDDRAWLTLIGYLAYLVDYFIFCGRCSLVGFFTLYTHSRMSISYIIHMFNPASLSPNFSSFSFHIPEELVGPFTIAYKSECIITSLILSKMKTRYTAPYLFIWRVSSFSSSSFKTPHTAVRMSHRRGAWCNSGWF